jgi:transcriptional regulator with XRE-family HTH domain
MPDKSLPLPKRLKSARLVAKMTQEKLGAAAGLDEAVASARMSQYENGVHTPDFAFVRQVSRILKVPTAFFYCEEDELAEIILAFDRSKKPTT